MKVTFVSSLPANSNVNNGGRKTLAQNRYVGQVTAMTDLDPLASMYNGKMIAI